jgi:hypothetical protein
MWKMWTENYLFDVVSTLDIHTVLSIRLTHFGKRSVVLELFVLFLARQPPPPVGQGLLIHVVSRSHATHHTR